MVADPDLVGGGSLSGDISGDETEDAVTVHVDDSGDLGCQAFLVVTAENGISSASVWALGATGGLETPTLGSLASIGTEPGLEVIVNEAAGASTQFVGAFTHTDQGLRRFVSPARPDSAPANRIISAEISEPTA